MKNATNEKGLTLLELIAALVLVTVVTGVITALIIQSTNGFNKVTEKQSLQEQARQISEQLVTIIRYTPWQLDKASQANNQELKLEYAESETSTYYGSFNFSSGVLTYQKLQGTTIVEHKTLADNIQSVQIDLDNSSSPPSVHFHYTLEGDNGETYEYDTKLYLQTYNR